MTAAPRPMRSPPIRRTRPGTQCRKVVFRTGLPLTSGRLVHAARADGYPVLFSANAFARTYPKRHELAGDFRDFRLPDPAQFAGLDAALDSAGFVAAVHYGDYRWSVHQYFDLVQAMPWAWYASMDYCVEPQVANNRGLRILRIAATAWMYHVCAYEARRRRLPLPMPVLQGWTPAEYVQCAKWMPIARWPRLVGIGSVCRRHVGGPHGIRAIVDALDAVLPAHVRFHYFGVKTSAMAQLATHERTASFDSQAWDFRARVERRTGRDMPFRIAHMRSFTEQQRALIDAPTAASRTHFQAQLFDDLDQRGGPRRPGLAERCCEEALAWLYAELLLSGDITYAAARRWFDRDAYAIEALIAVHGLHEALNLLDDEIVAGLSDRARGILRAAGIVVAD